MVIEVSGAASQKVGQGPWDIATVPNSDLVVVEGNKSRWSHADHRRHGWHNLHRIARYSSSFRAARVMPLEKRMDVRIAEHESVRRITALPWFSAMIVIRGKHILFERYAPDFGPGRPHSIQSITKTTVNLLVGQLVRDGILDPSRKVGYYIPEIGSGYADATLQQVLNMDVVNDYSEDFADPLATYYRHEEVMGWRVSEDPKGTESPHEFIRRIASSSTLNDRGHIQYKDANTDVIGWVIERASGHPLRSFLADIVDAAGIEGVFHVTTDRDGVPWLAGGGCLTARDLARYFSLFVRRGRGVGGEAIGSAAFIDQTVSGGVAMPHPYEWVRYSNHLMVTGRWLGHGGWGGQHVLAHLDTGVIGVFYSVLEDQHAASRGYMVPTVRMLETITAMDQ
jgi:CubicO group peptidase (beta-lactamase class C family)